MFSMSKVKPLRSGEGKLHIWGALSTLVLGASKSELLP